MKFGDSLFRIAWSKLQFPLHTQTTKSVTNSLYGGQKQVKQNLPFGNISSNDYSHKRNKLNGPTPEKGVRKYGTFPCHLGSFSCRENFSWAPGSDHLPIPNGKRIRRKLCAFFFFLKTSARHVQQDLVRQHFPQSSEKDEMLEKVRGSTGQLGFPHWKESRLTSTRYCRSRRR